MTHATLMNWEIALDAVGICCCVLAVLYLIKLKRKAATGRVKDPAQAEDDALEAMPMDLSGNMSFDKILVSAKNDCRLDFSSGGRGAGDVDPYDEVRRLLNLGMEPYQIAGRINIPQCEIDLIASLQQIQADPVSEETVGKECIPSLA